MSPAAEYNHETGGDYQACGGMTGWERVPVMKLNTRNLIKCYVFKVLCRPGHTLKKNHAW